jgi:hypothetical protein
MALADVQHERQRVLLPMCELMSDSTHVCGCVAATISPEACAIAALWVAALCHVVMWLPRITCIV